MKYTIEDIKTACPVWFSVSNLQFFRSRVHSRVYNGPGGTYFVSSEQFVPISGHPSPRRYTVRRFLPAGLRGFIDTVGEFQAYSTRTEAHNAAKRLANGGEVA